MSRKKHLAISVVIIVLFIIALIGASIFPQQTIIAHIAQNEDLTPWAYAPLITQYKTLTTTPIIRDTTTPTERPEPTPTR